MDIETVAAAAASAAGPCAAVSPPERATALVAVAAALESAASRLIPIAIAETGLSKDRLEVEMRRTCGQLRLFAEVGYHAATNAMIADAANLTRGAMLYHFASREELVAANGIAGVTWSAMLALGAAATPVARASSSTLKRGWWWPKVIPVASFRTPRR